MVTNADRNKLRDLAIEIVKLKVRPWELQTSNSFRRVGADGDGDVLCAVTQRSDNHPDLHAPRGVLDYIVATQPKIVLELIERIDELESEVRRLEVAQLPEGSEMRRL